MDLKFPLALRLHSREYYDPKHLDKRWDSFYIVPLCPRLERLEDHDLSPRVEQLDDIDPEPEEKRAEDDTRYKAGSDSKM